MRILVFLNIKVSGGCDAKLCGLLPSWDMFTFYGEVRSREYHEGGIGGLAKEGSSLRDVEELAWCSGIRSCGMKVGR